MAHQVRVSVRNLVEFILRNGDIDQKTGALQDVDGRKPCPPKAAKAGRLQL